MSIRSVYDGALDLLGLACAGIVLLLTLGVTLDVAVRLVNLPPLEWMMELSEYSLLPLTYLAAPWALREGAHVRVDVLVARLPKRLARVIDVIVDLLGLAVAAVLFIWGLRTMLASMHMNSMIYKVLIIPEWYTYVPLVIASPFLFVEFARRLNRSLRGEADHTATPENVI